MDNQGNTLDIKPILPGNTSAGQADAADANHPAAAAAARSKIEQIHNLNPKVTPATIISTSAGLAPKPFSPAERQQATNRRKRPRLQRTRPIVGAIMSFVFLLAFFKSQVLLSQIKYVTTKPSPVSTQPAVTTVNVGPEPVIIIPKITVNAPIIYEQSIEEARIQKALESGVVHYGTSAKPGQAGNNVIVGHSSNDWWEPGNYKFVFVVLDKLVPGDLIYINHDLKQYTYSVTEVKVVEPTDLSVLAPTPEPTLTLITCTPPGTAWKRLIIRAKQTNPDPTKVIQATSPTTTTDNSQKLPSDAPGFFNQIIRFWNNLTGNNKAEAPTTPAPSNQTPTGLPAR